jgi:integrase/recombinase XerD
MAKIKIVLHHYKKYKDGTSPILLRLTKGKSMKYFKIGDERFNILTKQWNEEFGLVKADKRLNPEHEVINNFIKEKYNQANKILTNYEEKGIAWTFTMFTQEYRNRPTTSKVKPFILSHIETLKNNGRYKSAEGLSGTLNLLEKFSLKFDKLYFQDIDYEFITGFFYYLKNERKNKETSIGVALRGIRTVLNEAINIGVGSKETYPFSKIYGATKVFKISKLEKRTKKRFIPKEHLLNIVNTEFLNPHLHWAQQLFLFSFFGSGINFKDMAFLTEKNIQTRIAEDGSEVRLIEFFRKKTNENIGIPITKQLEAIIIWARENTTNSNKYLLPIITNTKVEGETLEKHITERRKRLNKHLKTIAERLKFPESLQNIGSYHARHSYATTLLRNGAQIERISEALGHTSTKTTQAYLESFGVGDLIKLNEGLLD